MASLWTTALAAVLALASAAVHPREEARRPQRTLLRRPLSRRHSPLDTRHTALMQTAHTKNMMKHSKGVDDDDEETGYEYGDSQTHLRDTDSGDFSVHQFITTDDARGGTDPNDDGDDNGAASIARQQAEAAEDHFGSEDTPDTSFVQTKKARKSVQEARKARQVREAVQEAYKRVRRVRQMSASADVDDDSDDDDDDDSPSPLSADQFIHPDGAPSGGADDTKESSGLEMARQKAEAADDHFDSMETPSTDASLMQTRTAHQVRQAVQKAYKRFQRARQMSTSTDVDDDSDDDDDDDAPSPLSSDQFLHPEGASSDGADDTKESSGLEMARQKAEAADDHFDSMETPSTDASLIQTRKAHKVSRVARAANKRAQKVRQTSAARFDDYDDDDDDDDDASSPLSTDRFLHPEGESSGGGDDSFDNRALEKERAKAASDDDHYDSVDTPSTDN